MFTDEQPPWHCMGLVSIVEIFDATAVSFASGEKGSQYPPYGANALILLFSANTTISPVDSKSSNRLITDPSVRIRAKSPVQIQIHPSIGENSPPTGTVTPDGRLGVLVGAAVAGGTCWEGVLVGWRVVRIGVVVRVGNGSCAPDAGVDNGCSCVAIIVGGCCGCRPDVSATSEL